MKKISYYFILLFVGLTFLTSCDNEPLEGEFATTSSSSSEGVPEAFCEDATLSITTALASIITAPVEQQQMLCNELREMISGTITTCGDEAGFFQQLLEDLGDDCMIQSGTGDTDTGGSEFAMTAYY